MTLKHTPLPNGYTNYCPNDKYVAYTYTDPVVLENTLKKLDRALKSFGKRYKSKKSFGKNLAPFHTYKLSNNISNLGLPLGQKNYLLPSDPFKGGSPLPRPYGPRDNLLPQYFKKSSFGNQKKIKKEIKKIRKSMKKIRKKLKSKKKSKKFGSSPGSASWKNEYKTNIMMQPYNQIKNHIPLTLGGMKQMKLGMGPTEVNLPMQYKNNNLNLQRLRYGKKSENKSKKMKRSYGPNNVAYEKPFPVYFAGGNTINFMNDKMFYKNMVSKDIMGVQKDGITKNPWLTMGSKINNLIKSSYGKAKSKSLIFTGDSNSSTGFNTLYQYTPNTLKNYGKKSTKLGKSKSDTKTKSGKNFGSSAVITLDTNGKISLTKS